MRGAYGLPPERVIATFEALLSIRNLRFADEQAVSRALQQHRSGVDFADALHLNAAHACTVMLSFDGKFRNRAKRSQLQPPVLAP